MGGPQPLFSGKCTQAWLLWCLWSTWAPPRQVTARCCSITTDWEGRVPQVHPAYTGGERASRVREGFPGGCLSEPSPKGWDGE